MNKRILIAAAVGTFILTAVTLTVPMMKLDFLKAGRPQTADIQTNTADDKNALEAVKETVRAEEKTEEDHGEKIEETSVKKKGTGTAIINENKNVNMLKEEINKILRKAQGVYSIGIKQLGSGEQLVVNNKQMPSASVIKLYIMAEAFNQAKKGGIKFDEKIVLENSMKCGGTGSLQGSPEGTQKTIRQLVELMITESDNTATNIMIGKLGMDNINTTIIKLGFKDTVLRRKMMDMESVKAGKDNYTSVNDLINFFDMLYNGKCIGKDEDNEMLSILKKQKNNFKIPRLLPKGTVVAHKTGEFDTISNDAGIVFRKSGGFILCVLSKGVSNTAAADNTIACIAKEAYSQFYGDVKN